MRATIEKHLGTSASLIGLAAAALGYWLGADPETVETCLGLISR